MKQTLNTSKISQFRKDFLTLLGNSGRITDYGMAQSWRGYVSKWSNDFDDYLYKYLLEDFKNLVWKKKVTESDGKYWDKLIREKTWPFVMEFSVPIVPADDYYSEEQRFAKFQSELPKWKSRVMSKARAAWKVLDDFVSWYSKSVGEGADFEVDVPVRTKMDIEGFAVTLMGDESSKDADRRINLLSRGLKYYRSRANKVCPWLIRNQLPLVFDFKAGLDVGGEYKYSYILLSAYQSGSAESVAHVLAHEMAHHRYKNLGNGEREFWSKMLSGDLGNLDLREVVSKYPEDQWIFENKKIMKEDPLLYYQLDGLRYSYGVRGLRDVSTFKGIKEYLEKGGDPVIPVRKSPISSYANKNDEEAFCEALSYLVAFGPNSLPDDVLNWLRIILPSSHIASSDNLAVGILRIAKILIRE